MPEIRCYPKPKTAAKQVAAEVAEAVRGASSITLGLATGATPTAVYAEWRRLHRRGELSFANVLTFNLDEYWPIASDDPQSFRAAMEAALFREVDLPREQIGFLDGTLAPDELGAHCAAYEAAIEAAGGIDVQLLGIGGNGHIAFNEPGSLRGSRTRLVALDPETRRAARDAFGAEPVPERALTLGIANILAARKIYLLAFGAAKAAAVARALEGPVDMAVPASFLQEHDDVTVVLDHEAASALTQVNP